MAGLERLELLRLENDDIGVVFTGKKWNIPKPKDAIMVAVSAKALFDMRQHSRIFSEKGAKEYVRHMIENENKTLPRGTAFSFVMSLHNVNQRLLEINAEEQCLFDILLITNNPAGCAIHLINSINDYKLNIERACFTGGSSAAVGQYLEAYNTDLYLSTDAAEVGSAIKSGLAAATIYLDNDGVQSSDAHQLRIAFDADALLFANGVDPEARHIKQDLPMNTKSTISGLRLDCGPLREFAIGLGRIKKKFPDSEDCPIRTYLLTTIEVSTSGLSVFRTLRKWGIEIDEVLFLDGGPKGPELEKIKPHLFFDDSQSK